MNYYLGVDAGGSKTLAVITDETGTLLASGNSGPGNHQINVDLAEQNIQEAVNQALNQAGLQPHEIAVAWFGLAGADREADFRILRPMIHKLQFSRYDIVCDTMIALRAGTTRPSGVVVICGNGMNCAGVNSIGESLQCGGFGYAYGDFGGGSELAVEAFRAVIRAWEGRSQATLLTPLVLEALGYTSVEQMFHHSLDNHRRIPSSLTKLLFIAAAKGDTVSRNILQRQGTELGQSARAVIEKLGMQEDTFDLVLAGSVITKGEGSFIHPYIADEVHEIAPGCSLRVLTMEPVVGAILSAMEKDGRKITDAVYEQLSNIHNLKGVVTVE